MSELSKVLVVGGSEYAARISGLLSKAGLQSASVEETAAAPFQPDLILEAVDGDVEVRRRAVARFAAQAPDALLATTIAGQVTEIAAGTGRGPRTIGLHFIFNPFEDRCVVEVVRGLETTEETVNICRSLVERTGAVCALVEDVSGLVVDRVMASMINEAAYMLETKLASQEDINRIPKSCLNWTLGPFELADLIGIDSIVSTLEKASAYSAQYIPCRLLREMVAAGRLGRKSGRGFYDYTAKA